MTKIVEKSLRKLYTAIDGDGYLVTLPYLNFFTSSLVSESDVRVLWKSFQRWDDEWVHDLHCFPGPSLAFIFTQIISVWSGNGTIEDKEFLAHIDERPSFFTLAIFRFIDENSDGIMSFSEFIHASMKFGLLSQNEILECLWMFLCVACLHTCHAKNNLRLVGGSLLQYFSPWERLHNRGGL